MAETGAAAAQRYREEMRAKAERLGGGEDAQSVDSSSFTPGEKLYAGVKTGMRPVSRQARKHGGTVQHGEASPLGEHALKRPGRAPRKAGGRVEDAVGKGYVNRDSKAADKEREGHYPNGGMKAGGRAHRAGGGYIRREEREGGNFTETLKRKTASQAVKSGDGRPAAEDGRLGRASGGRAHRDAGGPLATPLAAGMGGQGRFNFNYGPQSSTATKLGLKDGGRAKAHERYGHGPSCACPDCKGKAAGGRVGRAHGGSIGPYGRSPEDREFDEDAARTLGEDRATPGSVKTPLATPASGEHTSAAGAPQLRQRAPRGEASSRAGALNPHGRSVQHSRIDRNNYEKGGSVEKKVLTAHRAEHEAMAKGRASGGRAGKGKTNINIIIAPGGGGPQGPGDPSQNPALAVKPPPAAPMPMPMPPPGGAAPGAPMPMPIPMAGPAGPPGPPGMPPRARGGRAPKVRGEPEAGSGSGLGRLQKAEEYGHRSREGEGLRK